MAFTENPISQLPTIDGVSSDRECPFVSKNGPECPLCGAPPTSVNLDESGRYGQCDDCGGKFPLK